MDELSAYRSRIGLFAYTAYKKSSQGRKPKPRERKPEPVTKQTSKRRTTAEVNMEPERRQCTLALVLLLVSVACSIERYGYMPEISYLTSVDWLKGNGYMPEISYLTSVDWLTGNGYLSEISYLTSVDWLTGNGYRPEISYLASADWLTGNGYRPEISYPMSADWLTGNGYLSEISYLTSVDWLTGNGYLSEISYLTSVDWLTGNGYRPEISYLASADWLTGNGYLSEISYLTSVDWLTGNGYLSEISYLTSVDWLTGNGYRPEISYLASADWLTGNGYRPEISYLASADWLTGNGYLSEISYPMSADWLTRNGYLSEISYPMSADWLTGNGYLSEISYLTSADWLTGNGYRPEISYLTSADWLTGNDTLSSGHGCNYLGNCYYRSTVSTKQDLQSVPVIGNTGVISLNSFTSNCKQNHLSSLLMYAEVLSYNYTVVQYRGNITSPVSEEPFCTINSCDNYTLLNYRKITSPVSEEPVRTINSCDNYSVLNYRNITSPVSEEPVCIVNSCDNYTVLNYRDITSPVSGEPVCTVYSCDNYLVLNYRNITSPMNVESVCAINSVPGTCSYLLGNSGRHMYKGQSGNRADHTSYRYHTGRCSAASVRPNQSNHGRVTTMCRQSKTGINTLRFVFLVITSEEVCLLCTEDKHQSPVQSLYQHVLPSRYYHDVQLSSSTGGSTQYFTEFKVNLVVYCAGNKQMHLSDIYFSNWKFINVISYTTISVEVMNLCTSLRTCSYLLGNVGMHSCNGNPLKPRGSHTGNPAVEDRIKELHYRMVNELSGCLDPNIKRSWTGMTTLLQAYFKPAEIKHMTNMFDICEKMLAKGEIEYGQYEALRYIFSRIGHQICCRIVDRYSQEIQYRAQQKPEQTLGSRTGNPAVEDRIKELHYRMVNELSGCLDPNIKRSWTGMTTLLQAYFKPAEIKHMTNMFDICEKMLAKGEIGYGQYETLREIFSCIGDQICCRIVDRYSQEIQDRAQQLPEQIGVGLNIEEKRLMKEAIEWGTEKDFYLRINFVGHTGAGKTTIMSQMFLVTFDPDKIESTNGINISLRHCFIDIESREWYAHISENSAEDQILHRFKELLHKKKQNSLSSYVPMYGINILKRIRYQSTKARYSTEKDEKARYSTEEVNLPQNEEDTDSDSLPDQEERNQQKQILESQGYEHLQQDTKDDVHLEQMFFKTKKLKSGRISGQASARGFDYAGQTVYYAVHQLFLSQRGINLIVMDASKDFDAAINDDDVRHIGKLVVGNSKDFFKFWAKSFRYYLPKEAQKRIIIVFTHTDLVDDKEEIKMKKTVVMKIVERMGMQRMFFDKIFCVNARNPKDNELQDLRETALYLSEGNDAWGRDMPSLWLLLEDKLMKMKSEGVRVMKLDEVEKLNEISDYKLKSRAEIFLFLKTHHEIGTLMHYADEKLQELVILDAQWLIDSLKTIIAAKRFLQVKYEKDWDLLHDKGILYYNFMEKVWQEHKKERFYEFKDELFHVMSKSDLIASPKLYSNQSHASYCIVPCMLKNAPENFLEKYKHQCMSHNQSLVYEFEYGFLPTATVYRLLAACIAFFGESLDSNGSMFCDASRGTIFCNAAAFRVSERHYLLLEISPSSIIAMMTVFGQDSTDRQVCHNTRLFLTQTLKDIIAHQKASSEFTVNIPCCTKETFTLLNWEDLLAKPQIICDKHSPEPPHPVNTEQLLQNWLVNKEKEGDRRHLKENRMDDCVYQIASRIVRNAENARTLTATVANKLKVKIPDKGDEYDLMKIILWDYLTLTKPELNISNLLSQLREIVPNGVTQMLTDALNTHLWKTACTVKFEENATLFNFEYDIPFADKDNDIIVLKIAGNETLPKPVVLDTSEPPKEVKIFGFPKGEKLYIDMKCPVVTHGDSERKLIEGVKEWWKNAGKSRQYIDEHFGRTENRIFLHTSRSFEHGASGSPVTRVDQQRHLPLVCMIYQCGYPAFYYSGDYVETVPACFEGGISIKFVANLIANAGLNRLKLDLFGEEREKKCVVV